MKFACDNMLGALAKWLRVCGLDVFYDTSIDRSGLFRVAREEGRTILTRTQSFHELKEIPEYKVIKSEIVKEQLREFYALYEDLEPWKGFLSRCVECNEPLKEVEKKFVEDRLPPLVKKGVDKFMKCPACDRIYWEGTHVTRMKDFLKSTLSK